MAPSCRIWTARLVELMVSIARLAGGIAHLCMNQPSALLWAMPGVKKPSKHFMAGRRLSPALPGGGRSYARYRWGSDADAGRDG
jgi:hypothetical protein